MRFQLFRDLFITAEIKGDLLHVKIENVKGGEWCNVYSNGFIQKMSAKCGEWLDIDELCNIIESTRLNREQVYIIRAEEKYNIAQGKSLKTVAIEKLRNEEKVFLVFVNTERQVYYPLPLIKTKLKKANNHHVPGDIGDIKAEIENLVRSIGTDLAECNLDSARKAAKRLQLLNHYATEQHGLEIEKKDSTINGLKKELQISKVENIKLLERLSIRGKTVRHRGLSHPSTSSRGSSVSIPRENRAYQLRQRFLSNRQQRQDSKESSSYLPGYFSRGKSTASDSNIPWWDRLSRSRRSRSTNSRNSSCNVKSDISDVDSKSPLAGKIKKLQTFLRKLKTK